MSKAAYLRHIAVLFATSTLTPVASPQAFASRVDPTTLAFEVVAVHPDSPNGLGGMARVQWRDTEYEASHVTVKELVREAYGVQDVQIQNDPKWMDSEPFTVEARVDATTHDAMKRLDDAGLRLAREHMLRRLLTDRFRFALTPSVRQLPIYEVVFGSEVPGLHRPNAGAQYTDGARWGDGSPMGPHVVSYQFIAGHIEMKGRGASLDQLVDRLNQKLSTQLGRTFVNATNLAGDFDFALSFTVPWKTVYGPMESSDGPSGDSTNFTLFTAFKEQLGLRMKSTKAPVRTLWIEHVEQPTEN